MIAVFIKIIPELVRFPYLLGANLSNNQQITLAEFNNNSLVGIHKEKDGYFIISNKKVEYHYVLTDTTEGNYTAYYYSDYENILIWWEIGCSHDITLRYLFDIAYFYGHIIIEDTNFDIRWTEYSPIEGILPLITTIVILIIFCVSFLVIFLLVRKKLKSAYRKRRGKEPQIRKKKKNKFEKW